MNGWFSATAERKRTKYSRINLIMDITLQMVFARLREDERHEPRGGGWSLGSNSLDIFGLAGAIVVYFLGDM